jgi:hypothetical protein
VETPRPEQGRHIHLLSYLSNLATRGGKEHFMYAVTVETPGSVQARHAHLSSYRGNLKNVYYNIVVVPAIMVKTRIMCTYV